MKRRYYRIHRDIVDEVPIEHLVTIMFPLADYLEECEVLTDDDQEDYDSTLVVFGWLWTCFGAPLPLEDRKDLEERWPLLFRRLNELAERGAEVFDPNLFASTDATHGYGNEKERQKQDAAPRRFAWIRRLVASFGTSPNHPERNGLTGFPMGGRSQTSAASHFQDQVEESGSTN